MPKYLITASYSAEGLRGLQKDKASGRRQAVTAAIEGLGGKVESFYNALGADDAYVIADLPDNSTAAALGIAVSARGWFAPGRPRCSPSRRPTGRSKRASTTARRVVKQQDAGCSQKVAPDCSQCRTISSPVANHTPACERMYLSAESRPAMRCGTPIR